MKCVLFIALLLTRVSLLSAEGPITFEPKSSLHLTQEGLLVEAGSAGQFTLNYPVLVGARWDDVRKPIGKKVSGDTATLQFDGPTRIEVVWQPVEGTLTFTPIDVPAGVKSLRADMLIDFSYVNAFFHLGICGFGPCDDYTYIAGRERVYEWLPAREGEFASAYHPDAYWNSQALSFHLVNTIRKTGTPYDPAAYTARMIERVRKWGFNSIGAFIGGEAGVRRLKNFPYVAHLPLSTWEGFPDVPGAHGIFDPFSDELREHCDKLFAERLPPAAADPLVIGYFLANEPLWEEIPGAVAALDSSHPCKRRLATMLEEKYKTIEAYNRAWETPQGSFAEVATRALSVKTASAKKDMQQFTGMFLEAYFRLVRETFHKYDKNHLLIGNRFQPGTINNETVCQLSGKYMDLVSFNYYAYGFDAELLGRIRGWMGDRPMFFSEFYFSSPPDSGLTGGGKILSSQRARGLAYRHYVEHAAALGYVVGIEWFTLVDQATTGRFFEKYNGEAANTGLISVADRPWKTMLEEMLKTNSDIYKVFFGERPPFVFDDPRFTAKK